MSKLINKNRDDFNLFSAMSTTRCTKGAQVDSSCNAGKTRQVHKRVKQFARVLVDDQFSVPLFSYEPSDSELDEEALKILLSEIDPIEEDDSLRERVLERQQLKKSLQYARKSAEKARMMKRRNLEDSSAIVEEKEFKRHAAHMKVVSRAREDARNVREYQARHRSFKRQSQHLRRSDSPRVVHTFPDSILGEEEMEISLESQSLDFDRDTLHKLHGYHDMLRRITLPIDPKVKKLLTLVLDCAAFTACILGAKDNVTLMASVHLFARARDFGIYEESVLAVLTSVAVKLFNTLTKKERDRDYIVLSPQALSDDIREVGSNISSYLNCATVIAFKKIVSLLVGLEYFTTKETAFKIYAWIPRVVKKETTWPDMIEMGLDSVATIVRVGELLAQKVPLTQALFSDDPLEACKKRAAELLLKKDFTYVGLPIDGFMERTTFNREVAATLQSLSVFMSKMSGKQKKESRLDELFTKLTLLHLETKVYGKGRTRAAPLGIVVHGASSIGKSIMVKYNAKLHCDVVKRSYNPDLIYQKNDEPYWNGYCPASNPYIQMPEVGCTHTNIASRTGDPMSKMLLALVDTNPFNCEMADVDSKGKVYAVPELVLIDTNIPSMNFSVCFNNPAAFARRFVYVYMEVLDEYKVVGSHSIDPEKVRKAGKRELEAYKFSVYRKVPVDVACRSSVNVFLKTDMDIHQYSDYMRAIMISHIADQQKFAGIDLSKYGNFSDFESFNYVEPDKPQPKGDPTVADRLKDWAEKVGIRTMAHVHKAADDVQTKVFDQLWEADVNAPCPKIKKFVGNVLKHNRKVEEFLAKQQEKVKDSVQKVYEDLCKIDVSERYQQLEEAFGDLLWAGHKEAAHSLLRHFATYENGVRVESKNKTLECLLKGLDARDALDRAYEEALTDSDSDGPDADTEMELFSLKTWDPDFDDDDYDSKSLPDNVDVTLEEQCNDCAWMTLGREKVLYDCAPGVPLGDNHWIKVDGRYVPRVKHLAQVLEQRPENKPLPPVVEFDLGKKVEEMETYRIYCDKALLEIRKKYFELFREDAGIFSHIIMIVLFLLTLLSTKFVIVLLLFHLVYFDYQNALAKCAKNKFQSMFVAQNPVEQIEEQIQRVDAVIAVRKDAKFKWWMAFPIIAGVAGLVTMIVMLTKENQLPVTMQPETTDFEKEDESNAILNQLEEEFSTDKPADRILIKNTPDIWNRCRSIERCAFTGPIEELENFVKPSLRRIRIIGKNKKENFGFLIRSNIMLMVGHSVYPNEDGSFEIQISSTGDFKNDKVVFRTKCGSESLLQVKDDLYMVQVMCENTRDLVKHFSPDMNYSVTSKALFNGRGVVARYYKNPKLRIPTDCPLYPSGSLPISDAFYYNSEGCVAGACTLPLYVQKDVGGCIAAIHVGGNGDLGAGIPICRTIIEDCILSLTKQSRLMPQTIYVDSPLLPKLSTTPHPKSFLRYEVLHGVEFMGTIENFGSVNNKSQVVRTKLDKDGEIKQLFFEFFGHISSVEFGPPVMKEIKNPVYINPWNINVVKISTEKVPVEVEVVSGVVDNYFRYTIARLRPDAIVKPWDIEVAINGAVNDGYVRRIDAGKSAGFMHPGPKSRYLELVGTTKREPIPQIKAELAAYLILLKSGYNPGAIFVGQLKDEPRTIEKIRAGKTRLFCVSEIVNLIACRMFLGPLFSMVMENNDAFRICLGADMHRGGVSVFKKLTNFSQWIWEGDYSNWDQTIPFEISWGASTFFYKLAQHFGYSESSLNAVRGLLTDAMFPIMVINGDVLRCSGFAPSGLFGTVELNSVKNNICKQIAFNELTGTKDLYFESTESIVTGDDTGDAVREEFKDQYNGVTYQRFCKERFGMTFTPTDKNGSMTPFVDPKDFSFLKRRCRFSKTLQREAAFLDLDSCVKTLTWTIPSGVIDPWNQMIQAAESVLTELLMQSPDLETFEKVRTRIINLIGKHYLVEESYLRKILKSGPKLVNSLNNDLPDLKISIEDEGVGEEEVDILLHEQTWSCFGDVSPFRRPFEDGRRDAVWRFGYGSAKYPSTDKVDTTRTGEWCGNARTLNKIVRRTSGGMNRPPVACWFSDVKEFAPGSMEYYKHQLDVLQPVGCPIGGINPLKLTQLSTYTSDFFYKKCVDRYLEYISRKKELEETIKILESDSVLRFLSPQSSGWEANDGPVETERKVASNLTAITGQVPEESFKDSPLSMDQFRLDKWDNTEFLKRPVFLTSGTWTVNDKLSFYIEPWKLYLQNPAVRSKIRNQWLLKNATLVVRITFSGTPFHQGRAIGTYLPMGLAHPISARYIFAESNTDFLDYTRNVYFSQQKQVFYADPADNQPYDIKCPLVKFQPYLRFNGPTDGSVLGSTTEFNDFKGLGVYTVCSMEPLEAVSTDPTNVTYNIYAWMEDVEVGVNTGTKIVLDAQSEDVKGPMETTAMAAAEVASSLSNVPIIGPYAKAGEMIFRGMGKLASLNGFSRPVVNTEPHRFKNEPFQNSAVTIGSETAHKINIDPKSELALGNTVDGETEDEMHFKYIYSRESYITTIDWRTTDTIMNPIYTIGVNPSLCPAEGIPLSDPPLLNCQPTPASFLASFFANWRGTMVLRFDIVKSKFHGGSLGFIFEPNAFQYAVIKSSGINLNVEKALIIDLKEVSSFEIEIYWNQGSLYLPTLWNASNSSTRIMGPDPELGPIANVFNGFISVFPVTTLQAPMDMSVHILCFSRWKDLEFNAYTGNDDGDYCDIAWTTESKFDEVVLSAQSSQVVQDRHAMNEESSPPDWLNVFEFGEKPCSWRTLLKRWSWHAVAEETANGANAFFQLSMNQIPVQIIRVDGVTPTDMIYSTWGAFPRVRLCYLGLRGSHKYKIMQWPYISSGSMEPVGVGLLYIENGYSSDEYSLASSFGYYPVSWGKNGATLFIPQTQGGIEVQIPQYTNNLWALSATIDPYDQARVPHLDPICYKRWFAGIPQHYYSSTQPIRVSVWHAVGDDFTFMRFMGAPPFTLPAE